MIQELLDACLECANRTVEPMKASSLRYVRSERTKSRITSTLPDRFRCAGETSLRSRGNSNATTMLFIGRTGIPADGIKRASLAFVATRIDNLVLASSSPRRLDLLRSLNLHVEVIPSAYDEPDLPGLLPRALAIVHARHKCNDVRARAADRVVVAADTVVDVDGHAFNKPRSAAQATSMLRTLSGRTHIVHTAFAVSLPRKPDLVEACESSLVTFFRLTVDEIDDYVGGGEPMDKAGAYGIQGYGATLVERVDGDFYTVMGFPVARFVRTMRELGFELPIKNKGSTLT